MKCGINAVDSVRGTHDVNTIPACHAIKLTTTTVQPPWHHSWCSGFSSHKWSQSRRRQGEHSLAFMKSLRMFLSRIPTYLSISSGPLTERKLREAFAIIVFPHAGGPKSITPTGVHSPIFLENSGFCPVQNLPLQHLLNVFQSAYILPDDFLDKNSILTHGY